MNRVPARILRFAPVAVCAAGILLGLYALAVGSGASLPYPDPTPENLATQREEIQAAWDLARVGAAVTGVGLVWEVLRRWRRAHAV